MFLISKKARVGGLFPLEIGFFRRWQRSEGGWLKPVVLMPEGADAWAETDRSSALFHELSHVKRADYLFTLLIRFSLAVFWWNPLCWVVSSRIRKEQEIACDELVLRAGIKPSTYAASLLAFRRSADFRWNVSADLLGLIGRLSFQERLAAILKQKLMFKEVKMKSKIMLAAAVVLAVILIGTARPAVGNETNAETSPAVRIAPATNPESVVVQEKEKEKVAEEKEKKTDKKAVVFIDKSDKARVEIAIVGNGPIKKLLIEKDGAIRLRVTGEGAKIIQEGKLLTLDENDSFTISKDSGKILMIGKSGDWEPGEKIVKVIVRKNKKDGPEIGWTIGENEPPYKKIVRIREGDIKGGAEKLKVTCERDDEALRIVLTGKKGPEGRAAYDRVLARLKNEISGDGKILESDFNENNGEMTFKISLLASADEDLIKKLVESATEEIKK
ncbi:MAG: M56 family metallopeptidase [Candidatus Aminicenantales bacterium]